MKKLIALLLALVMTLSVVSVASFAEDPAPEGAEVTAEGAVETIPGEEEPEEIIPVEEVIPADEPAEPEQPEEPAEPEEPAQPDEPAEPEQPEEPAEPEDPAQPDEPVEPEQPEEPAEPEEPAQPEAEAAAFTEGYVSLKKGTPVYAQVGAASPAGTVKAVSAAWAAADEKAGWLFVTFDTEAARAEGADLVQGYVEVKQVSFYSENAALAAELQNDAGIRTWNGHAVPVADYAPAGEESEPSEEPAAEPAAVKVSVSAAPAVAVAKAPDYKVEFTASATEGAAYQWQCNPNPETDNWYDMDGETGATLAVAVNAANDVYSYRCAAELNGKKAVSSAVYASRVTIDPASQKVAAGNKAWFYAKAYNLKTEAAYQWQSSSDAGETWADIEGKTEWSLAVEVNEENLADLYRCVISANGIDMVTSTAKVVSDELQSNPSGIVASAICAPAVYKCRIGSTIKFVAKVTNPGPTVKYMWQYTTDNGITWNYATSFTGCKTDTITVKVTETTVKYRFRCIVQTRGQRIYTKQSLIFAVRASASVKKVDVGKKVKFSVEVWNSGSGLKIQWQYSRDKGKTWVNSTAEGNKTKTLTVTTTGKNAEDRYRCQVSGAKGETVSNIVYVTPNPRYFALVVANSDYEYLNDLPGVAKDGKAMKKALTAYHWTVKYMANATYSDMKNAIKSYFGSKLSTDVCLFYYSGHGDNGTGNSAGALCGVDYYYTSDSVWPFELRDWLLEYTHSQVIIMLDSCGSGATVISGNDAPRKTKIVPKGTYTQKLSREDEQKPLDGDRFVSGVLNAFNGYTVENPEDLLDKTGELRNKRFAVLAACEYGKTSQDIYYFMKNGKLQRDRGGTFTVALLKSMGCAYPGGAASSSIPADSNHDKRLTLKETLAGIKKQVGEMNKLIARNGYKYWQYDPAGYYYVYTIGSTDYYQWFEAGWYQYSCSLIEQKVQAAGNTAQFLFKK